MLSPEFATYKKEQAKNKAGFALFLVCFACDIEVY